MNKKGSISSLVGLCVVLIALVFLIAMQKGSMPEDKIMNMTWFGTSNFHNKTLEIQYMQGNEISKIVYTYIDFVGYASFEAAKLAASFGNKYHLDGVLVIKIIMWILILYLLVPLAKLLLLFGVWINEFRLSRKEKKELDNLKVK